MNIYSQSFLITYGVFNFLIFLWGLYQCRIKANSYGVTWPLFPIGIFVWGDAVIFGLFWTGASLISLILNDWILFLLIVSVFWLVRSVGETIYWFNQQFTTVNRYPPEQLMGHQIFRGKLLEEHDAIWFVNQIGMQCITVITIITTIYLTHLWLWGNYSLPPS